MKERKSRRLPKNQDDYARCRHCREEKGDHRNRDLACPVLLERRGTYSHDVTFEPMVEEAV